MKPHTPSPQHPAPPLLKPLDDTPPSPEQYARFYALAKRILDEAPWEYLEESQVVAVERNAAETDFVSVMGALGTHFAVAVYPSLVCLGCFMTLDGLPQHEAGDLFFELPQHQLVFGSKSDLFPGEREALEASGLRFKNGKWPSIQAFVPGYYPWKAGAKGLEALCVTLEQLLAVLDDTAEIPFAQDMRDPFLTRFQKDGAWHTEMRTHEPKIFQQAIELPQDLLAAVQALPVQMMCMEIDCFPMMARFGKKGERNVCPRQLMMVDRASHFVFPSDLISRRKEKPGRSRQPFRKSLASSSSSASVPRPPRSRARSPKGGANNCANCWTSASTARPATPCSTAAPTWSVSSISGKSQDTQEQKAAFEYGGTSRTAEDRVAVRRAPFGRPGRPPVLIRRRPPDRLG